MAGQDQPAQKGDVPDKREISQPEQPHFNTLLASVSLFDSRASESAMTLRSDKVAPHDFTLMGTDGFVSEKTAKVSKPDFVQDKDGIVTSPETLQRSAAQIKNVESVLTNTSSDDSDKLRAAGVLASNGMKELKCDDGRTYDFSISADRSVTLKLENKDGTVSEIKGEINGSGAYVKGELLKESNKPSDDHKGAQGDSGTNSSGAEKPELIKPTDGKSTELKPGPPDAERSGTDKPAGEKPGADKPNAEKPAAPEKKPTGVDALFDPTLSPEQKLQAARVLADSGVKHFVGPDGKHYEIGTHKYGSRESVSIFQADKQGHSHLILRGIVDDHGKVSKQRDRHGHDVDYTGQWGKTHQKDCAILRHDEPKPTETKPGETKPGDTKPREGETKPGETKPGDTKPREGETKPGETKPGDTRPHEGDTKPGDTKPGEIKPGETGDTKPGDTKPGDTKPGDTKPGDTKPGDTKPGDTKPGDTRPGETGDTKPGDTKPGDTKPGETKPREGNTKPGETKPGETGETKPGDTKPGDNKPGETKPGETGDTKPGDTKPGETKPGETGDTKPGDTKPGDTKPGDTKPGDTKPAEGEHPRERVEQTPEQKQLQEARDHLRKAAEDNIKSPEERAKFLSDMEALEKRAQTQPLSPKEIADTYNQLSKLLEAKEGKVPREDRILAAETFAHHMADPTNIDQGQHNTCNVTSLEEHIMSRNPSKAAEIVASMAINGDWTAPDGRKVKIDPASLTPGAEERNNPPADNKRSFATQLMNLALVNDISQRRMPPEFYSQGKSQGQGDLGERLRYADGTDVTQNDVLRDGNKNPWNAPNVHCDDMTAAARRLTGDTSFVIANQKVDGSDGLVHINSPQDLSKALTDIKHDGKMPAIIMVDVNRPPFGNNPNAKTPAWHVVSVVSFDPQTGKVGISNQWGKANDITTTIDTLYGSTTRPVPPAPPPIPPSR